MIIMERYLGDRTAGEYRAHMNAIKQILDDWNNGDIGTATKRSRIAAENARFYDGGQLGTSGSALTSEPRVPDDIAYIIADGSGLPLEAVQAALDTRRRGSLRAASAATLDEAREAIADGEYGYGMIIKTASR
jgi:hypothetical protein